MPELYAVLGAIVLFIVATVATLVMCCLLAEIQRLQRLMLRDAGVVASLQTDLDTSRLETAEREAARLSLLDDLNALEKENVFVHQANTALTKELAAGGPAQFTVRGRGYVAIGNRN